ncbi:MAG TPA: hypothetical protein VGS20_09845 [Candidatus Acidoferrales bacterium]|nr:hypothetical protein [Candidatus Acidoferrales bacterium]
MATGPEQRPDRPAGINWRTRAVLFWMIMVALGVVMWKMASTPAPTLGQLRYSDFLNNVDKKNVPAVAIVVRRNAAEATGRLRDTGQEFSTLIPRETIPGLVEKLRQQGATIEVKETVESDWLNLAMNALPLVILVAMWIFMMRRMRGKGAGI